MTTEGFNENLSVSNAAHDESERLTAFPGEAAALLQATGLQQLAQADAQQQGAETAAQPGVQTVAAEGNVVKLPAGTSIEKIEVDGNNLVLVQPDGSRLVIENAALHVPTFLIDDVEIPQEALVAAFQASNINVAAGPDGGLTASSGGSTSSGGDFSQGIPDIGDAGPAIDLLDGTSLQFAALDEETILPAAIGEDGSTGTGGGTGTGGSTDGGTRNSAGRIVVGSHTVYEAGLPGGSATSEGPKWERSEFEGSEEEAGGEPAPVTVEGVFTISDPDGLADIASLTINGKSYALDALVGEKIQGEYGELTITGYNPATGEVSYSYELLRPYDNAGEGVDPDQGQDIFTLTITDRGGLSASADLRIEIIDDAPLPPSTMVEMPPFGVDETTLGQGAAIDATDFFPRGFFYGADGPHAETPVSYAFLLEAGEEGGDVRSGLHALDTKQDGGKGAEIALSQNANGDIEGKVGGTVYFTIKLVKGEDDQIQVKLDQIKPLWHGNTDNSNEAVFLTISNGSLKLSATVMDSDGDTASSASNLSWRIFSFNDDGPLKPNVAEAVSSLEVSEATLDSNASVDAATFFPGNFVYGQDGPNGKTPVSYALKLSGTVGSGLYAVDPSKEDGKGAQIMLSRNAAGNIEGKIGDTVYFTIKLVNGSEGQVQVELDQQTAIWHGETGSDVVSLNLASNALQLSVTVMDGDGDTASNDFDLGKGTFTFRDATPDFTITLNEQFQLVHDESLGAQTAGANDVDGGDIFGAGRPFAPLAFKELIQNGSVPFGLAQSEGAAFTVNPVYGADGEGAPAFYELVIGNGGASGLKTTAGADIVLEKVSVGGIDYVVGRAEGKIAFALHLDANGKITMVQWLPIQGTTPGAPNELDTLTKDALSIKVTVTDGDGDTKSDTVDISGKVGFLDDAPEAYDVQGLWTLDDENRSKGNADGPGDNFDVKRLDGSLFFRTGVDGLKEISVAESVKAVDDKGMALDKLQAIYVDPVTGIGHVRDVTVEWTQQGAGGKLVGMATKPDGGTFAVFTLTVDKDGDYKLDMHAPLAHPFTSKDGSGTQTSWEDDLKLEFTYKVTDRDGDSDTAKLTVKVDDDSPQAGKSVSGNVSEGAITGTGAETKNLTSAFDKTVNGKPDLGPNVSVNAGSKIATHNGDSALQSPEVEQGIKPIIFTAAQGATFTIDKLFIGLFGVASPFVSHPMRITLKGYNASGSEIASYELDVSSVAHNAAKPSTLFDAINTAFAGKELSRLEILPPNGYAGFIILDDLSGTQTVGQPIVPAETKIDLTPSVAFGADGKNANGGFQFKQIQAPESAGVTSDGNAVKIERVSDGQGGYKLIGYTGTNKADPIFTLEIKNGEAVFKLYHALDHAPGKDVKLDFGKYITAVDGDGDAITLGTVAVTVRSLPAVTPPAAETVDEAGLPARGDEPAGSKADLKSETAKGTIAFAMSEAPSQVKLGGFVLKLNQNTTFEDERGELVARYTYSSGKGTIHYTYTLKDNTSGEGTSVKYEVVVKDAAGQQNKAADLTINILDDAPTAKNDTENLAPNTFTEASGNVITGVGTHEGAANKDIQGADGARVSEVISNNPGGEGSKLVPTGGQVQIMGQYGTLVIKADGSYTYVRSQGTPGGFEDKFTYTLKDGDGDASTATLTIKIGDAEPTIDGLALGQNDSHGVVYEAGLSVRDGEPAGSGTGATGLTATGSFTIASPDGLKSLKIGGEEFIVDGAFKPGTITTAEGTLTLTYSNGTVSYTYTLKDNASHSLGDNPLFKTFDIQVTDLDNDKSSTAQLVIKIVDDAPKAPQAAEQMPKLDVDETSFGTDKSVDAAKFFQGSVVYGADGANATTPLTHALKLTAGNAPGGIGSGLYALDASVDGGKGKEILLSQNQNGDIEGVLNGKVYFTITLAKDGNGKDQVVLDQKAGMAIWHADANDGNDAASLNISNGSLKLSLKVTDGDGDARSGDADLGKGVFVFHDSAPQQGADVGKALSEGAIKVLPGEAPPTTTFNFDGVGAGVSAPLGSHLISNADPTIPALTGTGHNTAVGGWNKPILITAIDKDVPFVFKGVNLGFWGSGNATVWLEGYDAKGILVARESVSVPSTPLGNPLHSSFTPTSGPLGFAGKEIAQLKIIPPQNGAIQIDNLNVGIGHMMPGTVTPAETTIDLSPAANFGADGQHAKGGFKLGQVVESDLAGIKVGGAQVRIETIAGKLVGHTGNENSPVFTLEVINGQAVFKLYSKLDHVGNQAVNLNFGQYILAVDGDGDTTALKNVTVTVQPPGVTTPVILDLNHNGVETIDLSHSNVAFDYNNDGVASRTAWVGPHDGILAIDLNGDGKVGGGSEIVFTQHVAGAATDLAALAQLFDTDGDGKLTAADHDFARFGVWQDANSNGVSDPGEFKSLNELGIVGIELHGNGQATVSADGSVVTFGESTFTLLDGTTGTVADIGFGNLDENDGTSGSGTTFVIDPSALVDGDHMAEILTGYDIGHGDVVDLTELLGSNVTAEHVGEFVRTVEGGDGAADQLQVSTTGDASDFVTVAVLDANAGVKILYNDDQDHTQNATV